MLGTYGLSLCLDIQDYPHATTTQNRKKTMQKYQEGYVPSWYVYMNGIPSPCSKGPASDRLLVNSQILHDKVTASLRTFSVPYSSPLERLWMINPAEADFRYQACVCSEV